MSWPVAANLAAHLRVLGVDPAPADLDLDKLLTSAIEWWESFTGWSPFLAASGSSVTLKLDSSGPIRLPGGWLSVSSIVLDGATLLPSAYQLEPLNAIADGRAFTSLNLFGCGGSTLVINGTRGRVATLPATAWFGVLDKAAANALEMLDRVEGAVKALSQGSVSVTYQSAGTVSFLSSRAEQAAMQFKKESV